ncbi:Sodium- and chloride-dependent glycine transporter 2, partial [Toxocara canis]
FNQEEQSTQKEQSLNEPSPSSTEDNQMPSSPITTPVDESLIDKSLLEWQDEESAMAIRYRWPNSIEGIVTFCSYVCCPASMYILPRLYGKHGAAFTYCLMIGYIFVGLPAMYLEMALGQYTSTSPHRIFSRMVPAFSGISISMIIIMVLRVVYLAAQLTHVVLLLILSLYFQSDLPWASCDGRNLTGACYDDGGYRDAEGPLLGQSLPFTTYLFEEVYQPLYKAIDYQIASLDLTSNLIFIWVFSTVFVFYGICLVGKVAFVTTAIPLAIAIYFFIRGATLEGFGDGALYLLNPARRLEAFFDPSLYADAITFVLLSLRLGDGGILHIASHNKFHNNVAPDAMIVVSINLLFSLLASFGTFFYLGHISHDVYGHSIDDRYERMKRTIADGVLDSYPIAEVASTITKPMPGFMHAAFFFTAVLLTSVQTLIISLNVIVESIEEKWPHFRRMLRRIFLNVALVFSAFLCGYFMIVQHGYLIIIYFRKYISYALASIVLFEIIAVAYAYRLRRFLANIRTMVGGSIVVKAYWWMNWFIFSPILLVMTILMQIFGWKRTMSTRYYPIKYIDIFGWMLTLLIVGCVPGVFLFHAIRAWRSNAPFKSIFRSDPKWGPADTEDRLNAKKSEKALRAS